MADADRSLGRGRTVSTARSEPPARSTPRPRPLGWAGRAALLALMAATGLALALPWGPAADLIVGLLLGLALLGLGALIVDLLRLLVVSVPARAGRGIIVASAGALVALVAFMSLPIVTALALWSVWLAAFTALALGLAAAADARRHAWLRMAAALVGVGAFAAAALWWLAPGDAPALPPAEVRRPAAAVQPDPDTPGPFAVGTFTYGAGGPRWRDTYAPADVATTPVDLADLVDVGGVAAPLRRLALGHGLDAVPRNALVWHPQGDGPFPLVLIAHGNANLFVPSETGYAWLGAHLASHGFVVASIDASAFNTLPIAGSLRGENDARALLMLAHLQVWRDLAAAGHPVAAQVDLDRVALAGHSRGGEAAAIAAALDRLGRLPADAARPLAERVGGPYDVRAVVAFAPSDGQYQPGDRGTRLVDVDYLVIQGGHDADVSSFMGERQFERVDGDGFRAAIALHRANHGQFNTRWGRFDAQPPFGSLLLTGALMTGDAQRRAGALLVTAFLRASLLGETQQYDVLRNPVGHAPWLRTEGVVARYDAGGAVPLASFDEDVDPVTATLPGATVHADGLAVWREGNARMRLTAREQNAVTLGWLPSDTAAAYRLDLPAPLTTLTPDGAGAVLRLDVGRGAAPLPGRAAPPTGPLDASVVLVDGAGREASLPLSRGGGVPPDLPATFTRFPPFEQPRHRPERYPLFATVDLPLAWFPTEAGAGFDIEDVREVALRFDLVPEGAIVLRRLVLAPP
jgi:hypothetical protein